MIVGLTGGIGSGKSMIAKLFAMFGAKVFNSDECAKQLYFNPAIKKEVVDLLGRDAYLNEQTLNKKVIAEKIFSNTKTLQQLNEIIHPAVANEFRKFVESHPNCIIIKESALLFETGLYKQLDKTILVTSPLELRVNRVMQRDQLNETEVLNKIKSQLNEEEKLKLTDIVIENNEKDLVIPQCLSVYQNLKHA